VPAPPDTARHAFNYLIDVHARGGGGDGAPVRRRQRWPQSGLVDNNSLFKVPPPPAPNLRQPLPITLEPRTYRPPALYKRHNTLQPLRRRTMRDYWATPRAGLVTASQVMTERTSHDLPTQIRYEKDTRDDQRHCATNPEWIEWLMGYPAGWTQGAAQ
jgi:hypothetical protein